MATHSSVLAWRIPGMGEPGGLPSMGSHRVGHDWSNLAAVAAAAEYKLSTLILGDLCWWFSTISNVNLLLKRTHLLGVGITSPISIPHSAFSLTRKFWLIVFSRFYYRNLYNTKYVSFFRLHVFNLLWFLYTPPPHTNMSVNLISDLDENS